MLLFIVVLLLGATLTGLPTPKSRIHWVCSLSATLKPAHLRDNYQRLWECDAEWLPLRYLPGKYVDDDVLVWLQHRVNGTHPLGKT